MQPKQNATQRTLTNTSSLSSQRTNSFHHLGAIGYDMPYVLCENITSIYEFFFLNGVSQKSAFLCFVNIVLIQLVTPLLSVYLTIITACQHNTK